MLTLTFGHCLQRAHHQAIVHLALDPLRERLVFLHVLANMHQQLRKCEAANREGMDKQGAGVKGFTQEQFQQRPSTIQTPARPQEILNLEQDKQRPVIFLSAFGDDKRSLGCLKM